MLKIHLKAHNGQYLCAEGGGGRELVANRNNADIWESFTLSDENGGGLLSGDAIYMTAYNGKYICAEGGGGREVIATKDTPLSWERFVIEKRNGSGIIKTGDLVSLKCSNGQYICAEGGGGREVVANRSIVDVWETFTIEIEEVATPQYTTDSTISIQPPANSVYTTFTDVTVTSGEGYPVNSVLNRSLEGAEKTAHLNRLKNHLSFLKAINADNLSDLGPMTIGGNVVPQNGITSPRVKQLYSGDTAFSKVRIAFRKGRNVELHKLSGTARTLGRHDISQGDALMFSSETFLDKSYIYAKEIHIANNSNIILKSSVKNLVIIANKIVVGTNVKFTWEGKDPSVPEYPGNIKKLPNMPDLEPLGWINEKQTDGRGANGANGLDGLTGYIPEPAPSIEIWTLEFIGNPQFELCGIEGGKGGPAQDGQNGQNGAPGKPEEYDFWGITKSGPGCGGHGGNGGNGGKGGDGGTGGRGGQVLLYAPVSVVQEFLKNFSFNTTGGIGGEPGQPGKKGIRGFGGPLGKHTGKEDRLAGSDGRDGTNGKPGANGQRGDQLDSVCFAITKEDIEAILLEPAIATLSKYDVKAGEILTVSGCRFEKTDKIMLGGIIYAASYINSNTLQFTVPKHEGGLMDLYVQRKDGTLSNKVFLKILPAIESISSPEFLANRRFMPGKEVNIIGSGFNKKSKVMVNNIPMCDITFIDSKNIRFNLIRPEIVTPKASGEIVGIKIVHEDGTTSNEIEVTLDTFRMMVLGDSIMWGQGLRESDKIHSLVEKAIKQKHGNIGVYKTSEDVRAHSGAIIGVGVQDGGNSYYGEVPCSYPTIITQCFMDTEKPETVDFILMDGGINDVSVMTILNPATSIGDLKAVTRKHCYEDMRQLLKDITSRYINAIIVVTGYYQIVSNKSDTDVLDGLLLALGVCSAGINGGIVALALDSIAINSIIKNCKTFSDYSKECLSKAVDEVNQIPGHGPVYLAIPPFTENNSVFASDPWIYGINKDLTPQDDPTVAAARKKAVEAANFDCINELKGIRASAGHPNTKGAQKYADEVIRLLFGSDQENSNTKSTSEVISNKDSIKRKKAIRDIGRKKR